MAQRRRLRSAGAGLDDRLTGLICVAAALRRSARARSRPFACAARGSTASPFRSAFDQAIELVLGRPCAQYVRRPRIEGGIFPVEAARCPVEPKNGAARPEETPVMADQHVGSRHAARNSSFHLIA